MDNKDNNKNHLQKVLKPVHIWAFAVGAVISGDYYGFSYGFLTGGPVSLLVAFVPVTLMYVLFILCYMELGVSMPSAAGAAEYAGRAMGRFARFITGFSVLVTYIVSPVAVAIATGQLIHNIFPQVPPMPATVVFFVVFVAVNLFGAKSSSVLELVATIAALAGLLVFAVFAAPHFEIDLFVTKPVFTDGVRGVAGAAGFAMWFFFAIDSAIMQSEEMEDPVKGILKGYVPAMITLTITALAAILLPAGIADYKEVALVDFPLMKALELAMGKGSLIPKAVGLIALFSMVASFSSIVMSYSRQAFAMGRERFLPEAFTHINKYGCPHFALLVPSVISLGLALTGRTALMVTISVFAALLMYLMVVISNILLHRKGHEFEKAFKLPYPVVPMSALVMVVLLIACVVVYNISVIKWVILLYIAACVYYKANGGARQGARRQGARRQGARPREGRLTSGENGKPSERG